MNEHREPLRDDSPAALAALVHPDKDMRQRAAVAAGQRADPQLAPRIAELLWREPDFFVRETLTWVLTRTPQAAAEAASSTLSVGDGDTRLQALHLLSKLSDPTTVPVVAQFIDDADPRVADKARWALARIADPSVIPLLVDRLGDTDQPARDAMTAALSQLGAPAVPTLSTALTTANDPSVRAHAAEVLCFIGAPGAHEAVLALADVVHDDHPDVRLAATLALRELVDHPAARTALREASLSSDDPQVRTVARLSLERPGGRAGQLSGAVTSRYRSRRSSGSR